MGPSKLLATLLLALYAAGFSTGALAQESNVEQIFLDEPDQEPPANIVKKDTHEEKYDDKTTRVIRGLAYLSDDQIVNHGKYVEFYPDGQKFSEGTYQLGLYSGDWQFWHPNGQLCKTVTFDTGKPNGSWDILRPEGTRRATKGYQNGLRHGSWVIYFKDGESHQIELTYEKGKLVGERLTYYQNGQLRQKLPFENGVVHGTVVNWDEDGNKSSEIEFKQGKPSGKSKRF